MIFTYLISNLFIYSWIWNPLIGLLLTFLIGFLCSFLFKETKSKDEIYRYTIFGQRKEIIEKGEITEEGVNKLPLSLDRYSYILIIFFILQYLILYLLQ